MLIHVAVYTYGSQLEAQSVRFSGPGDFFTYLIFVGTTIMVSLEHIYSSALSVLSFSLLRLSLTFTPSPLHTLYKPRISARPAISLAEAVPGSEGDCPCISCSPSFAIINTSGLYAV